MPVEPTVAYFSMEIGLKSEIPNYAGGLGVLAGDTVRSAAALGVPMVAVTLLYRDGYFEQTLDEKGRQTEHPEQWDPTEHLERRSTRAEMEIHATSVTIGAWEYAVEGPDQFTVPVILLDTDLSENTEWVRRLTNDLYGGDSYYRLCQEALLGIGGVRMLRALGHEQILRFHMNEGHSSMLTLELLNERMEAENLDEQTVNEVREKCIFTTHTPVPAGHDKFNMQMVRNVIGDHPVFRQMEAFAGSDTLNMTYLALNLSGHINGVSKKHREVTKMMFQPYTIDSITNGVNVSRWTSAPFRALFDRHLPGWSRDPSTLRSALNIPGDEIWEAHRKAKQRLLNHVEAQGDQSLDPEAFTIGFGRRATAYKRPDLIFFDLDRLRDIASRRGPIQIVFGGKAHPADVEGKEIIRRIFEYRDALRGEVPVVYLEDYEMDLAGTMTAGVDLWLNTPRPPMEASGTSGMKSALNGVPQLSVFDGWWIEGCVEGATGWGIGERDREPGREDENRLDAESLYRKLDEKILPMYYERREAYTDVMRHCIAINGAYFNARRMVLQYVLKVYQDCFVHLRV